MKSLTHTPGTFRAHCRISQWKPISNCTPDEFATATARGEQSRWDQKLKSEVLPVHCDETFDDTAIFERHMLEQHGRKPGQIKGENETFVASVNAGWKAPRLTVDGKALTKAAAAQLRVCPTCDLYGEVDTKSSELWWAEHLRGCALAAAS